MGVYYIGSIPCSGDDVCHFGRKGMKWGQTIFGDLADRLAKRGWTGASNVARGISTGFGRANEFINADQARANLQRSNRMGPTYQMDTATRNAAQAAYNRTLPGMIDQARGAVGNAAASARERATQAMADAREKVSSAYADAAKALGDKGRDIQTFYRDVMQKAQGAINRGKSMVSQYGGQFVSQIETLGKNALTGGKSFLDGIMERARNAGKNAHEFVTGENARRRLNSPTANMDENTRKNNQAAYDRTLPGMIERAGRAARGAGGRARSAVNDASDRVRDTAGDVADTVTRKTKRAASLAKTFSEHPVAYTKHYVTSEKNKKKTKMDPNSLYYDKESGTTKAADSSRMVPENHPEAQRHTRYIDYDGNVRTSQTNTYMGYKNRMQDPGHLDPREERAFARAKKRSNKR